MFCQVIGEAPSEELLSNAADLLEFRLDLLEGVSPERLKGWMRKPSILTLRTTHQGGRFAGSEAERLAEWRRWIELKPAFVDLEFDSSPELVERVRRASPKTKLICSYHDLEETPRDLERVLEKLPFGEFLKIATFARSTLDGLRMLELLKNFQETPLTAFCLGEKGRFTRILGRLLGNRLTYAGDPSAAPGLLPLEELMGYHFPEREAGLYGLIGDPVEQSLSHRTHNRIMRRLNLQAAYVKMALSKEELPEFLRRARAVGFRGLSVTMPLKEAFGGASPLNTLALREGSWSGFNTDGSAAKELLGEVRGKEAVILGAGGAALAIAAELIRSGARVRLLNRTLERAKRGAELLGCSYGPLEELGELGYEILIQATPVGMDSESCLFESLEVFPERVYMELISSPAMTPFAERVLEGGGRLIFGKELFIAQAIGQFLLWFPHLSKKELMQEELWKDCL